MLPFSHEKGEGTVGCKLEKDRIDVGVRSIVGC